MSDFKLLLLICGGLYASECFIWVPSGGLMFLAWANRFGLSQGPAFRFKNPWPSGFSYRFDPADSFSRPASLNSEEAKALWQKFQDHKGTLLGLSRGLLLVSAGAFLLWSVRRGFSLAWAALFGAFLLLHLAITFLLWKNLGKIYPGEKNGKLKKTLLCGLSPFQSMRSLDLLGEGLFKAFHPLVVGHLLLTEGDFLTLCRRWLLEIRHESGIKGTPETSPLLLHSTRAEEEKAIAKWMNRQGIKVSKVLAPLQPSHPSHLGYCQRCETEYQIANGRCRDCGRDLIAF